MQFMLAWTRPADKPPLTQDEHAILEEALDGHSWAIAGPGIYVIAATYGPEERYDISTKLTDQVKEKMTGPVSFLISPPMEKEAGLYIGAIDKTNWPDINRRTGYPDIASKTTES